MSAKGTLVLKSDPQLGLFLLREEGNAQSLEDRLAKHGIPFERNPPEARHLVEDGKVVFVFGKRHPEVLVDSLVNLGADAQMDHGVVIPEDRYLPPVNQLLRLDEPDFPMPEDYTALGISEKDIPELIRMATDEALLESDNGEAGFAPVHAWRMLARMGAKEAIRPLVGMLPSAEIYWDDWIILDLPKTLAQFGGDALPEVTLFLSNPDHGDLARGAAGRVLGNVGETCPELRTECITRLATQLESFEHQSEALNASLVGSLMDLGATEAMTVIARAFEAGRVDESVNGDVEDVEIKLGLRTQRERPRKPNKLSIMGEEFRAQWRAAGLTLPEDIPDFEGSDADLDFESGPDFEEDLVVSMPYIAPPKTGRNDPCPCASGKKFKKCCGK